MATNDTPQSTSRSYHYLHLMPGRGLLQIIAGILATPQTSLTLRIVAADLLYTQAQRISTGQLLDEAAPVVSDIKAVSERLGMRPVEVRRAYEQLAELGGVHILARQFPKRREQP